MIIAEVMVMESWVELISTICVIVAGCWALWQWRQDKKNRCADIYAQLLSTYMSAGIFHAFEERIDKGGFRGMELGKQNASCGACVEELDKVLMFLNQICYMWMNGMIRGVELQSFRYPLVRTLTNEHVLKYLESLQDTCSGEFMFESLMKFAETINRPQTGDGKKSLTEKIWHMYLIDRFGGWTKTAESVASRINVICSGMDLSIDGLVKSPDIARQNLIAIGDRLAGKSPAQISSYRTALRHCCMAKHGVWLKDRIDERKY